MRWFSIVVISASIFFITHHAKAGDFILSAGPGLGVVHSTQGDVGFSGMVEAGYELAPIDAFRIAPLLRGNAAWLGDTPDVAAYLGEVALRLSLKLGPVFISAHGFGGFGHNTVADDDISPVVGGGIQVDGELTSWFRLGGFADETVVFGAPDLIFLTIGPKATFAF